MPPFIFLIRAKSAGHNIFLPLPVFLLPLIWLLLLPLAAVVGITGALMLLNRKGSGEYALGRKILKAAGLYMKALQLYAAFSGFKVDVKSSGGDRVLIRAI